MHKSIIVAAFFALAGLEAGAATVSLQPATGAVFADGIYTVIEGTGFSVDLLLDATDAPGAHPGLYAGEIVVSFDPALVAWGTFSPAGAVSLFSGPATSIANNLQTITLGFENATDTGVVGTFTFTALGDPGSIAAIGIADADDFFGTFVSLIPTNQPFYPEFIGTQVSIAAVPLPASAWLLGAGLGVVGAWRSRRKRRAGA